MAKTALTKIKTNPSSTDNCPIVGSWWKPFENDAVGMPTISIPSPLQFTALFVQQQKKLSGHIEMYTYVLSINAWNTIG